MGRFMGKGTERQHFQFFFLTDSYGGFIEETSVENRLKKILSHHKVTALIVTRVLMPIYLQTVRSVLAYVVLITAVQALEQTHAYL